MKPVVFTYMRMNPPTIGHDRLITALIRTAKDKLAEHMVYLSQTTDTKKNPLTWREKIRVAEQAFPGIKLNKCEEIKTPFQALESLCESGFKDITFVVGEDRVPQFKAMEKYAIEWGASSFKIISAGNRNVLAEGVEGVSASQARQYVIEGKFDSFTQVLPKRLRAQHISNQLYTKLRARML